jgi:hypothetical protein
MQRVYKMEQAQKGDNPKLTFQSCRMKRKQRVQCIFPAWDDQKRRIECKGTMDDHLNLHYS